MIYVLNVQKTMVTLSEICTQCTEDDVKSVLNVQKTMVTLSDICIQCTEDDGDTK